jgi:hypothetical protein
VPECLTDGVCGWGRQGGMLTMNLNLFCSLKFLVDTNMLIMSQRRPSSTPCACCVCLCVLLHVADMCCHAMSSDLEKLTTPPPPPLLLFTG